MLLFVLACCFSIAFSFVCSISEATLYSVSQARIEALVAKGSRAGTWLRQWKQQPDRPIAAVLVLNTIANVAFPALGIGAYLAIYPHEQGPPLSENAVIAVLTVAILLLGEIAPKTIGVVHANAMAIPAAHAIRIMILCLGPVLLVTRLVSRLVGAGHKSPDASLEEIRLLATAGQAQGAFGALTAGLIANATRLRQTRVREVMVPRNRVAYLSGNRTMQENLDLVHRTGHSRFPFTATGELDQTSGVILTKELLFHLRQHTTVDWNDLLVPLVVVPETAKLNHLLRSFQKEKRHMALVVDEYGATQGLVTLEDVLEEIVGEIQDELDADETHLIARPDGSLLCRGVAEVRKVFHKLNLTEVETQSQTISGFLAEQLGDVPYAGAEIEFRGYRFVVTKANNRRADRIRILPLSPVQSDATAEPAS